jgi:hypothetical protein
MHSDSTLRPEGPPVAVVAVAAVVAAAAAAVAVAVAAAVAVAVAVAAVAVAPEERRSSGPRCRSVPRSSLCSEHYRRLQL